MSERRSGWSVSLSVDGNFSPWRGRNNVTLENLAKKVEITRINV